MGTHIQFRARADIPLPMSEAASPIGIYIHFPFCVRKCRYCDFNSSAAPWKEREQYLAALETEIAAWPARRRAFALPAATVYFGGGTPSLYPAGDLARILASLGEHFTLAPEAEITCEINPGTITARSLAELRACGFNRLSIGVQSFRDEELEFLGRIHSAAVAEKAVADAHTAGFANVSLDLIRALPGQTLDDWSYTLHRALSLRPEHLSTYGLSIEPDTPLFRDLEAGVFELCDEDTQIAMFEHTRETLTAAGYEHYEISNYARRASNTSDEPSPFRCRHNENYWRNGGYVGFGAGAWSYMDGVRSRNVRFHTNYIEAVLAGIDPTVERDCPDARTSLGETIMLALRTSDGVSYSRLADRFGVDVAQEFAEQIAKLTGLGLIESTSAGFRLTPHAYLLESEIAAMFLD